MADLSIARAREIGERWAGAWSQADPSVWTDIYADDATYIDYAFGFIRRGKKGLHEHFNIWKKANPDFHMSVVEAWPGMELNESTLSEHVSSEKPTLVKYSVRTRNFGTFTGDLPSLKASGKRFEFYAVVDIVVRAEDGLILRLEEWYHKQFDGTFIERDAS